MLGTPLGIIAPARLLHPRNAEVPMPVTFGGIASFSRPAQPENALLPMFVTLFGIATSVRPVLPEKAEFPISASPSGRDTRLAAEHPPMKPKNKFSVPGKTTTSSRFQ